TIKRRLLQLNRREKTKNFCRIFGVLQIYVAEQRTEFELSSHYLAAGGSVGEFSGQHHALFQPRRARHHGAVAYHAVFYSAAYHRRFGDPAAAPAAVPYAAYVPRGRKVHFRRLEIGVVIVAQAAYVPPVPAARTDGDSLAPGKEQRKQVAGKV